MDGFLVGTYSEFVYQQAVVNSDIGKPVINGFELQAG
jgi:hypothetical protein